jgi:Ca2+-binding EF-hand superfamily protein
MRTVRLTVIAIGITAGLAAQERGGREGGFARPNLLWTALDTDHDGTISAEEIANSPAALRALDKNHDGNLTLEETRPAMPGGRGFEGRGGRGPEGGERREGREGASGDTVEETVKTLMAFDANGDGKLQKSELPERMQGIFERGDTNKDGVLTVDEIRVMARAQAQAQRTAGGRGRAEGEREGGRGGPEGMMRMMDPIFAALDANHDNVISAEEIDNAPAALLTLDKNHDGKLTEDELRPNFGPGRGLPPRQPEQR